MATSGDISWELDRDALIERAYAKIGIPGEDNSLSTSQLNDGAEALNAVIALAVTDGMPIWKRTSSTLTPSASSQVYSLTGAVKLAQVVLKDTSGGSQYDLIEKSLYDFNRLPQGTVGTPVHYTFVPNIDSTGTLSIWPLTSDSGTISSKQIIAVYQKEFDGMFNSTDTLDFPSYWTLAIIYRVAQVLAPEQGVPLNDRNTLTAEANAFWKAAKDYGDEDGSIFIQPSKQMK